MWNAASSGQHDVISFLVQRGADVNAAKNVSTENAEFDHL